MVYLLRIVPVIARKYLNVSTFGIHLLFMYKVRPRDDGGKERMAHVQEFQKLFPHPIQFQPLSLTILHYSSSPTFRQLQYNCNNAA